MTKDSRGLQASQWEFVAAHIKGGPEHGSVFEGTPRRELLLLNLSLLHKTIHLKTKTHRGASLVTEGLGAKAPLTKS